MYIKEIELNNFRIYKGKNKISLLPEGDKNIIVISGKNGYGKTTFLMSLVWCLYGKQMEKVDELYEKEIRDKGNYTKYISNSLNRKAYEEGITEFSVSVTFTDVKIPEVTCNEVTIKRSYNIVSNSSDRVEVLIDGYPNQLIEDLTKDNQRGEEIFIRDFILPIEIAKFFFFDAEKIVSLAEINSSNQRRQLSKAYSEVLGIQKYEDLKANLEEKQDEYRRRSAKPEEKEELNLLHTEIENTKIKIEGLVKNIEDLKYERNQKEKDAEDIQRRLIKEGDKMTLDELNSLKDEQSKLEQKKNKVQESLKQYFDIIPFALAGETLMNISEQLTNERNLTEQKYKQEDVNLKINQIKQEIEIQRVEERLVFDTNVRNFYEKQIEKLIKKYFFSDIPDLPDNFEVLHDFSNSETNEFNQLINTIKHSFKETFSRLNAEYSYLKNQLDIISRKIRDAEKLAEDEYIANLRSRKDSLDKRILSINNEIETLNQRIGELNNHLKSLRQRQEILRKKIDEASEYSEKEQKTKQIINRLQNFIALFKEEKKRSLEEKILKGLNNLLHKKDFITKVEVDISLTGEDIDISLYNSRNKLIDKGSLSMGERQMYASALLNALVDESDIEFPVFIDSPMQKFDEKHAENIIKYFYPNVSKQVVIFPLINKELTEKEYTELHPKVCKTFLINNISNEKSEFIECHPSEFLKTYKTLYNAD
ncbi:MAG TPA: DNA sulfur modification protein DndD [Bacteroidales bacterium]|nr:DNA sulfur modification protein DndD [Bacteroidales bacterium]HUM32844.1 DNA sulfur modification protein DndD [Bacteroidales bacterium]